MNESTAQRAFEVQLGRELNYVWEQELKGEIALWHNTSPPNIDLLKELIKRNNQLRVFIRNHTESKREYSLGIADGCALFFVYWGEDENPVETYLPTCEPRFSRLLEGEYFYELKA